MNLRKFSQSDLIQSAGEQQPEGVCQGLVIQWLIAVHKDKQAQFWKDLNGSLKDAPNVPFLGVGYARQAIEFQVEYADYEKGYPMYSIKQMNNAGLSIAQEIRRPYGAFTPQGLGEIVGKILESDGRYFHLSIFNKDVGHAIGAHRKYSLIGKGVDTQVFDPNIGEYSCNSEGDLRDCLVAIGNHYKYNNVDLYHEFALQVYKS